MENRIFYKYKGFCLTYEEHDDEDVNYWVVVYGRCLVARRFKTIKEAKKEINKRILSGRK